MPVALEAGGPDVAPAPAAETSHRAGFPVSSQIGDSLANRCVPGDAVTDDLIEAIAELERALEGERRARERVERRLVDAYDRVDDDLRTALDTCHQLEQEKLAAFAIDRGSDGAIFGAVDPAVPRDFAWTSLRAQIEATRRAELARYDEQLRASAEQVRAAAELHAGELRELERRAEDRRAADQARHADALRSMARDHADASHRAEDLERRLMAEAQQHAADRDVLQQKAVSLETMLAARTSALETMREELAATRRYVHDLLTSTSWKASRPLRGLARLLGRDR